MNKELVTITQDLGYEEYKVKVREGKVVVSRNGEETEELSPRQLFNRLKRIE